MYWKHGVVRPRGSGEHLGATPTEGTDVLSGTVGPPAEQQVSGRLVHPASCLPLLLFETGHAV